MNGRPPGFVDIHHHLLPGLDDGPRSWAESLAMARLAREAGIGVVVATPHVHPGRPEQPGPDVVAGMVEELRLRLAAQGVELEVLPGAEVYPSAQLPQWLSGDGRRWLLGRAASERYLLIDLPFDEVPPFFDRLLFEVALSGVVPVIAHPERNRQLQLSPERLAPLVERGAVAQVTAGSVVGHFGPEARRAALHLVERGLVGVVATDAHDVAHRSARAMPEAYRYLSERLGARAAETLCVRAPMAIAMGEPLPEVGAVVPVSSDRASANGPAGWSGRWRAWWERLAKRA